MKTNSQFKIFMQSELANADFKVLALLYQPLIGMEAYALHSSLYHLCLKSPDVLMDHQTILDILNIKNSNFIKIREKLEAVGLLETYKSGNMYNYILKPPFSAKQFLLDTILGTYLESEIGTTNLEFIANIFKISKPEVSHFENITKSFDDLYQFKALNLLNLSHDVEGRNGNNNKLIRNAIDYDTFVNGIPRSYQGTNLMNNKFKEQIMQIAFVYQFNVEQMLEVYKAAHKGRKNVTVDQINFQARQLYEKNNEQLVVSEKVDDTVDMIKTVSHAMIVQKFGQGNFRGSALSTVNEFINRNDIDPGILNVLLMFILKNKDGILPNVNYLDKVWESWISNGVQTVEDAISHRDNLEKRWSSSGASYGGTKQAKRKQPEWLDEYLKEISEMEG